MEPEKERAVFCGGCGVRLKKGNEEQVTLRFDERTGRPWRAILEYWSCGSKACLFGYKYLRTSIGIFFLLYRGNSLRYLEISRELEKRGLWE